MGFGQDAWTTLGRENGVDFVDGLGVDGDWSGTNQVCVAGHGMEEERIGRDYRDCWGHLEVCVET